MAKRLEKYMVGAAAKATTSKSAKNYLRMELYAQGGRRWPSMMWEDREPPPVGALVDCMVEDDEFNGVAQLKVHALRVVEQMCSEPDLYLPKSKVDARELWRELKGFVEAVTKPALRALLEKAVADKRWGRAPAAKTMHHAFLGGLLEHVVGICRLARAVSALYPEVDLDLLVAGAVLHDIGKMDEMDCGATIEYTTAGKLLGHVPIGFGRTLAWMAEDPEGIGPSTELGLRLLHLIGSHHGSKAYGAFQNPATLEAQVFSDLDGIDAHVGKIRAITEKAGEGKEWTEKVNWETPEIWLGKRG